MKVSPRYEVALTATNQLPGFGRANLEKKKMSQTYNTSAIINGRELEIEFTTYYDELDEIVILNGEGEPLDDGDWDKVYSACRAELNRLSEEAKEFNFG